MTAHLYTQKTPPLTPAFRAAVTRSFQDEIAQLQHVLACDLSHWLAPTPRQPVNTG